MLFLLLALFTITAGPDRAMPCRSHTMCRLQVQGGMTWTKQQPPFRWQLVKDDDQLATAVLEQADTLTPIVVTNGPGRWRVYLVASDGRDIQIDAAILEFVDPRRKI